MSVRSCWLVLLSNSSIPLLIYYLVVLSITERRVLKSPTLTVEFPISPSRSPGGLSLSADKMKFPALYLPFSDTILAKYYSTSFQPPSPHPGPQLYWGITDKQNCNILKGTVGWLKIHTRYERNSTKQLINIFITSHFFFFQWECLRPLSKYRVYNTVLSTTVTMLYIRSSEHT